MCRALAQGGRRCQESLATTSKRSLTRQLHKAEASGDKTRASDLNEGIRKLEEGKKKYGNYVNPVTVPIPQDIRKLLDVFEDSPGTPLLVGGTVRDAIRNPLIEPKDFDIEVHGLSLAETATLLKEKGYPVDLVGQAFGVIKTRAGKEDIDLSVPRKDSLAGVGHQDFDVEMDAEMGVIAASERRDFTINALMYDPQLGLCIDPHHGQVDLKEGVLRHVSPAFAEDPLRPLRGFQFSSRYGLTFAPETLDMCRSLRQRYSTISQERVMVEWDKFFQKAQEPSKAIESLKQMGWEDTVPGYGSIDRAALTKSVKSKSTTAQSVLVPAVMSAKMQASEREAFITSTVYGKKQQQQVAALSSTQAPSTVDRAHLRAWARDLNRNSLVIADWDSRERAFGSDTESVVKMAEQEGLFSAPPVSSLTGKDILAAYPDKKPGVWVGTLLKKVESAEDTGVFYGKTGGLEWLRKELS